MDRAITPTGYTAYKSCGRAGKPAGLIEGVYYMRGDETMLPEPAQSKFAGEGYCVVTQAPGGRVVDDVVFASLDCAHGYAIEMRDSKPPCDALVTLYRPNGTVLRLYPA